jgi:hypothetical protein
MLRCDWQYDSIEQAVEVTSAVLAPLLLELVTVRQLKVFVHPVPPVLKETGDVVQRFDLAVRKQIHQLQAANSHRLQGRLAYLDFFEQLLPAAAVVDAKGAAEPGSSVAEEDSQPAQPAAVARTRMQRPADAAGKWSLDGVHLHPAYITLLEAAMDDAMAAAGAATL